MAGKMQDDPARTYIQQLCEDTGRCPEDLPEAMNDREKVDERGSVISVLPARHDDDDDDEARCQINIVFTEFIQYLTVMKGSIPRSRQWSGRPGFNPRARHTKDFKNGT